MMLNARSSRHLLAAPEPDADGFEPSKPSLLLRALPFMLRIGFLSYPIVTNIAFEVFPCHDFGEDGRWLKVDVAIECGAAEHSLLTHVAAVAIFMYPVGLLLINSLLLCVGGHVDL